MLNVSHVRKEFGTVRAVNDVSFSIPRGSTFGLLGPNGAGKTTTMRMILRIVEPDGGDITWDGQAVDDRARRRFGYLPEERGLYGKMKVREQIAYFGRLHGLGARAAASATAMWIERLQLGEYAARPCSELSKGNQQKVQVACAAAHEPELLLLDEPFSGLDPRNAEMLLETLNELRRNGAALVLSSHQMWQLEELCDAFCIISGGTNRASGTLAQLRAEWPRRTIRIEPRTDAVQRVLEDVPDARPLPSQNGAAYYDVPVQTALPPLLKMLVQADAITRFESVEPSLQDIYLHAIGAS